MSADDRLIERCIASDERAQYALYKECYSLMKSICMRYIRDKSEVPEVMNQGFLKVIKSLSNYDSSKPFNAWVGRILVNTAIDHLRKKKRNRRFQSVDPAEVHIFVSNGQVAWNQADREYDADSLMALLHRLPEKTAEVFNLFAIDGYSHQEISQMLNISTGTSKWHVSKARESLRSMISEQNFKERQSL